MSSVQKTPKGYRAQVFVAGKRDSGTFRTKREADAWAAQREAELRAPPAPESHTLKEALERYAAEVTPKKRSAGWEYKRIRAFLADPALPCSSPIRKISPQILGVWRDARLRSVSAGTLLREATVLSAVFETARREWQWIESNPLRDMRKPRTPDHREVVLTRAQIRALLIAMDYGPRRPVRTVAQSVAACLLVALRTGMRAGELCGLTWDRVRDDYCILPETKTDPREVPISDKARRLLNKARGIDPVSAFGLTSQTLDANFRKYRDRAGVFGVTFNDSRHTAATWLARRIDVLDLCRMFGWANTTQALTYYNPSASSIAAVLNGSPKHGRPRR